jgi:lipoate-protein ligase A
MVSSSVLKSLKERLYKEREMAYTWRMIPLTQERASWQMAVDHLLLDQMEQAMKNKEEINPTFRVYRFSKHAAVLGNIQKTCKVDRRSAEKYGVDITTRLTGGGVAYFTPEEVHMSVVAPHSLFPERIEKRYETINSAVANALKELGIDAYAKRTSVRVGNNQRLFVSGQAKQFYTLLHHGTLHVNFNFDVLTEVLKATADEEESLSHKIALLSNILQPPEYSEVVKNIEGVLQKSLIDTFCEGDYREKPLTKEELVLVRQLQERIYDNFPYIQRKGTKTAGICQTEEFDWNKKDVKVA